MFVWARSMSRAKLERLKGCVGCSSCSEATLNLSNTAVPGHLPPCPACLSWDSSPACWGPQLQDRPTTATEILPPADPGRKGRGWIYELCRQRSDRTERYLAVPVPAEPGWGRIRGWQQEAAEGTGVRLGLSRIWMQRRCSAFRDVYKH